MTRSEIARKAATARWTGSPTDDSIRQRGNTFFFIFSHKSRGRCGGVYPTREAAQDAVRRVREAKARGEEPPVFRTRPAAAVAANIQRTRCGRFRYIYVEAKKSYRGPHRSTEAEAIADLAELRAGRPPPKLTSEESRAAKIAGTLAWWARRRAAMPPKPPKPPRVLKPKPEPRPRMKPGPKPKPKPRPVVVAVVKVKVTPVPVVPIKTPAPKPVQVAPLTRADRLSMIRQLMESRTRRATG